MADYRFVCVDAHGRWKDVKYATLSGDVEAKGFGCDLLRKYGSEREHVAVVIYDGNRKLTMLAELA